MTRTIFEKRFAGAAQLLQKQYNLNNLHHAVFCDKRASTNWECSCGLDALFKVLKDYEDRVKGRDEVVFDPLDDSRENWLHFLKALTPEELEYIKSPEPSEDETVFEKDLTKLPPCNMEVVKGIFEEPDIRDTEGGWKQTPGFVDKNGWRS